MDAHQQDQLTLTEQDNQPVEVMSVYNVFRWFSISAILFLLGLSIELGPKWAPGRIHIPLAPRHGFTDQDAFALIPISIGMIWFGIGIWKNRKSLQRYIRQYPEKSFVVALSIGLTVGLLIGILMGAIFEAYVAYIYRLF